MTPEEVSSSLLTDRFQAHLAAEAGKQRAIQNAVLASMQYLWVLAALPCPCEFPINLREAILRELGPGNVVECLGSMRFIDEKFDKTIAACHWLFGCGKHRYRIYASGQVEFLGVKK